MPYATLRPALPALVAVALCLTACDPGPSVPTPPQRDEGGIHLPDPDPVPDPVPDPEPEPDPEALSCGQNTLSLAHERAEIMLVLDKSGSMISNTWDHDRESTTPEVTRWFSLHGVVAGLAQTHEAQLDLGMVLFPAVDVALGETTGACRVDAVPNAPLGSSAADILAALPAASSTAIHGGTPASAGIDAAVEHLLAAGGDGPKAIILVTDGAANCSPEAAPSVLFERYDETLAYEVQAAAQLGIPVYVVGIDIEDELLQTPIANPWERLTEVAQFGGAPRDGDTPFYDVFDQSEFAEAIDDIANEVGCTVATGMDPDRVSLRIDGVGIAQVDSCEDGSGWRASEQGEVELCPLSCALANEAGGVQATEACLPEP